MTDLISDYARHPFVAHTLSHSVFFAHHLCHRSTQSLFLSAECIKCLSKMGLQILKKQLWCWAAIMCPIVPCLLFVMWPGESPPSSVNRSHTGITVRSGDRFTLINRTKGANSARSPSLSSCSASHDVSIGQRAVCKEATDETPALFLTTWRELKPSASSWSHSIPLAQTAPEIGPVFVRRSMTEMQPPPFSPPFAFPSQWDSGGLSGLWSGEKCLLCD